MFINPQIKAGFLNLHYNLLIKLLSVHIPGLKCKIPNQQFGPYMFHNMPLFLWLDENTLLPSLPEGVSLYQKYLEGTFVVLPHGQEALPKFY